MACRALARTRIAGALAGGIALAVAAPIARAEPGDELTVTVLTFGPGDDPFDRFGHDAIWIRDRESRQDDVYNYGTFDFDSSANAVTFFVGRFEYWLSRSGLRSTLRDYASEGRTADAQELNLTAAQKLALRERLRENLRPENRYYRYDYYRDNCSTRIRDLLDELTGGSIRAAARGPGAMTYREHTLRLTADHLPQYVLLDLVMGEAIDRPLTEWDEAFLPSRLQEILRRATVPGPEGDAPLVRSEKRLLEASRPPPRARPPSRTGWMAATGLTAGGALALLGRAGRRARAARVAFGGALSLVGLVLGFFGWFFLAAWALTDHEVGYRNENVLQCAPWAIALTVSGVGVARGRPRAVARARALVIAAGALAALGLLLKALPWLGQQNHRTIALLLPIWLGAAIGIEALRAGVASRPGAGSPAGPPS